MPVRTFVTAGAAFATAGMIAMVPAIAPPLTPRDTQVVKDTQVALTLTLQDLINVYFSVNPEPDGTLLPPTDPDNPGTTGTSGVIYQILYAAAEGNQVARDYISAFFTGGVSEVVRLLLLMGSPPEVDEYINAFFDNGFSGLVHEFLNQIGPAETDKYVNIFFNIDNPFGDDVPPSQSGASGVIYQYFIDNQLANGQPPGQGTAIDDLFQGGATQVAWHGVVSATGENDYTNAYFGINNNNINADSPSGAGISGVVYRALIDSGLALNDDDPLTGTAVDNLFNGGTAEVAQGTLLKLANGNTVAQDLINEFFDFNGLFGVTRYLLAGPQPTDNENIPSLVGPGGPEMLRTAVQTDPEVQDEIEKPEAPKTDVTSLAARSNLAAAPTLDKPVVKPPVDNAPASLPAVDLTPQVVALTPPAPPAVAPAPAPEPEKKKFTINEDKELGTEALENSKPKTTEEEVLLTGPGGLKPGTGWDAWNKKLSDAANAVNNMLKPKPAAPDAGPGDDAGGDAGGDK